jgi:IclR family transcriptional regulator, KDG regulon repressor
MSVTPESVVPVAFDGVGAAVGKRRARRPAAPAGAPGRRGGETPEPRATERTPANQSAQKALQVLDYFRTHGSARLSELAAHAGLNMSTALRLTLALQAQGAIVRQPGTRQYVLGSWVLELASSLLREQPLLQQAHAVLTELRDQTGETASLWVRDGPSRICLDRAESRHGLRSGADIGARLPPHRGAAGKVLLASLPTKPREALLADVEREDGAPLDALREELARIPAQGYAVSLAERERGVGSVAVPIADPRGRVSLVLNLSGPLDRFDESRRQEAAALLQRASAQLSIHSLLWV